MQTAILSRIEHLGFEEIQALLAFYVVTIFLSIGK
jgi:hypothetical protein